MKLVDRIFAWAILILGLLHCGFVSAVYREWGLDALWFVSGGLALIFAALLNLVRIEYQAVAPGTRVAAVLANIVMLLLSIGIARLLPLAKNPQVIVALALFGVELLFSILRREAKAAA